MRFLADESVSRLLVGRLRAAGLDVMAIGETGSGAPDNDVLRTASREGRIPITEDRDFGQPVVRQRLGVHGIILLDLDRLSIVGEADLVATVVSKNADKLPGILVVIEPGGVRVRPLPRRAENCAREVPAVVRRIEAQRRRGGPAICYPAVPCTRLNSDADSQLPLHRQRQRGRG